MNGQLLDGRYRLTGRIATGGMGEVWRGTDELLGRPVAVKLLSKAYLADEQFRARFRAEARYAGALSHQGIARVYDYGEIPAQDAGASGAPEAGEPYLVMELVDGEPLSAMIAREGPLDGDRTLDIVSQAASALQVAHEAGIVHRDIKPGNLLVTPGGTVKITDFGIARALMASQAAHLTQTGTVMGTAAYISPEQASGGTVTAASDIYSLGVVAYECLAGRPPFGGQTPVAIAVAHLHEPVPPLPASVPPPVAGLTMAMLAKNPADRPASAQVAAGEARQLLGMGPGTADSAMPDDGYPGYAGSAPTRLDYGIPAQGTQGIQGDWPYGDPFNDPERMRGSRRRRVSPGLVAAGAGVALAALGGVMAAFLLPGQGPAGTPASPPATFSSPAGASPAVSSPAIVQTPPNLVPGGQDLGRHAHGEHHHPSPGNQGSQGPSPKGPGKSTAPAPAPTTSTPSPTDTPTSSTPPASSPPPTATPTTSRTMKLGGLSAAPVANAIGPEVGRE